eukprot:2364965-Amphidinium_carterae.2
MASATTAATAIEQETQKPAQTPFAQNKICIGAPDDPSEAMVRANNPTASCIHCQPANAATLRSYLRCWNFDHHSSTSFTTVAMTGSERQKW